MNTPQDDRRAELFELQASLRILTTVPPVPVSDLPAGVAQGEAGLGSPQSLTTETGRFTPH
ncbi:MAG: hypothetical protein ACRDRV_16410 [Pseudonocardiaceae bacterium]